MKVYKGYLCAWFEHGSDGLGCDWILAEDGDSGYCMPILIERGDILKIFGERGDIIFAGEIVPKRSDGDGYFVKLYDSEKLTRVYWTQDGWDPNDWAKLFLRAGKNYRAELTKKDK